MLNISREPLDIEKQVNQYYVFRILDYSHYGKVLAYWLLGLLILCFIILFIPWQQNVRGNGTVSAFSPKDRPQKVYSIIPGKITDWYVNEGQYVNEGDSLVRIAEIKNEYLSPDVKSNYADQLDGQKDAVAALNEKLSSIDNQLIALREGLSINMNQAQNKLLQSRQKVISDSASYVAALAAYEVAFEQLNREEELFTKGLTSQTQLEAKRLKLREVEAKRTSAMNKLEIATSEWLNARLEISGKEAEYNDKISKALSERNSALAYLNDAQNKSRKLQLDVSNLNERQSLYVIRAPKSGYIFKSMKNGIGEVIKEGEPLLSIVNTDAKKAVEWYVEANDVPLLTIGTKVRMQFDGWPALVFSGWPNASIGTFGGKIAVVDFVNSYDNKYRVLVVPDEEEVAWPDAIRFGSGVYGWAMLKEVPIWFEIWRQLNAFPPLIDLPKDEDAGKDKEKKDAYKKTSKSVH